MSFYSYTNKQLVFNHQIDQQLSQIKVIHDHIILIFQTKCAIFSLKKYCLETIVDLNFTLSQAILFLSTYKLLIAKTKGIFQLDLLNGKSFEIMNLQNQKLLCEQQYFDYFVMFKNSNIILYYLRKDNKEIICYSLLLENTIKRKILTAFALNFEKFNEVSKMVIYSDIDTQKYTNSDRKIIKFEIYDCVTQQILQHQLIFTIDCRFIIVFIKEYEANSYIIGLNLMKNEPNTIILIYNHQHKIINRIFDYPMLIEKFINLDSEMQTLCIQQRKISQKIIINTIDLKRNKQIASLHLQLTKNLYIFDHCLLQFKQQKKKKIIELKLWKPVLKSSCYIHLFTYAKNQTGELIFSEYPIDVLEYMIPILKQ